MRLSNSFSVSQLQQFSIQVFSLLAFTNQYFILKNIQQIHSSRIQIIGNLFTFLDYIMSNHILRPVTDVSKDYAQMINTAYYVTSSKRPSLIIKIAYCVEEIICDYVNERILGKNKSVTVILRISSRSLIFLCTLF